jgi:hypothetical protein
MLLSIPQRRLHLGGFLPDVIRRQRGHFLSLRGYRRETLLMFWVIGWSLSPVLGHILPPLKRWYGRASIDSHR